MIFFHRYVVNQETNKEMPAIFFFSNIFLSNLFFDCFPEKYAFKTGGSFVIKNTGIPW